MERNPPARDHQPPSVLPPVPVLGRRHIQIWYTEPGQVASEDVLSAAEQSRLAWFKRDADRRRFVTAATLLRVIGGHHTGTPPHRLPVARSCPDCPQPHGKPRLPGSDLEVSIAHTSDRVVLAVTRLGPIGVDVERMNTAADLRALPLSILNPHELLPTEEHLRARAFLRYWTRKESVVKAAGTGLRSPLRDVVVSPHDQHPKLLRFREIFHPKVLLHDIDLGEDYVAAVALLAPGPAEITLHHASPGTACLPQQTLEERACA